MSNKVSYSDLWFYKGKYRTELGLKRALIKDDIVTVSPKRNYYCWRDKYEYFYPYDWMRDSCWDDGYITEEEYDHFRKWLNKMIKTGEIDVCCHEWYHCEENDNIGTEEFWETLEAVLDGSCGEERYMYEYIENAERTLDNYCGDILTKEEFNEFDKLPEDKQFKIAMKWRIQTYKDYIEAQNKHE